MIAKIQNYALGYRTVVVALDETVASQALEDGLGVLLVFEGSAMLFPDRVSLTLCAGSHIEKLGNYDVCTIWEDGTIHRVYDDASTDNYLFVTGMCNSNCVMCPTPEALRKNAPEPNIPSLMEIARSIPVDASHLTVTGGEPFIAGKALFPLISLLKQRFTGTEFLFLTNGRVFAMREYADLFSETAPANSIVAIPLHGSRASVHDAITQAPGSFEQTIRGVANLLKRGVRVEIRLVVSRLTVEDFDNIANLICSTFPGVEYVSVVAMEMTGNARKNKEAVWMPYGEAFSSISDSLRNMVARGVDVRLYNFPLCQVERPFWTLCEKSISPTKVKYSDVCALCAYKSACGGVFAGTYNLEKDELRALC